MLEPPQLQIIDEKFVKLKICHNCQFIPQKKIEIMKKQNDVIYQYDCQLFVYIKDKKVNKNPL